MAANLQSMYHYWKSFDLHTLQKELDTTATDLAARQDDSDVARKRLVEQSRDFKKNAQEDVRKQVAPLLKSFQAEIDSLSKRSKNAEGAFLSVYKRLIDAPDPGAVLEHALQLQKRAQKVQDLEIENKQLRETLDEYNHEFAEVKNQEVTIKGLREKLKEYEDRMEATAQSRAKEKEKELQRTFTEKERQLQETQLSVAKKLGEAEHKVATLQSALENTQSELFDLKAKYDEATSAKSDEMEMIMADLERSNERAAAAERETEQLHQHLDSAKQNLHQAEQMQSAPDMEQAIDILKRSSLEVELAAKEKEIAQLVEDVQRLQATVSKLRESSATQVARLEEELHTSNLALTELQNKIKTQEDYDEVKRELSLLKSIEFGTTSKPESSSEQGAPSQTNKAKTLETLLLEKNRSLQSENTQLKVSNNELTGEKAARPVSSTPVQEPSPPKSTPSCATPPSTTTTPSVLGSTSSSLSNTEMFASMLGQELVASYHLQNQFRLSMEGMAAAAQLGIPNGFLPGFIPPPPHLLPPMPPPPSSPATSVPNGHTPVPRSGQQSPLERIHSIAKSEINNAQALDTADVAQRIREVLSSHNIGQRLFAKHVLGLSQGTVSELLSKPKHWDKLTEKGRESYRKMALWANDEKNVLALKAISPKKGNQPVNSNTKQEDSHTEERIAMILSQAQMDMQTKHGNEKHNETNAMVARIHQQELAKISLQEDHKDSLHHVKVEHQEALFNGAMEAKGPWREGAMMVGSSTRGRKPQTDSSNLTQEMVARIYHAELLKLAQAAEQSGNMAECHMYRQELARQTNKDDNQENDDDKENNASLGLTIKREPRDGSHDSIIDNKENLARNASPSLNVPQDLSMGTPSDALRHAGSAFCLVRPRSNSQNGVDPAHIPQMMPISDSMSPLQRMQSIANSLMAKNNAQIQNQRPLRAVLPPITQEQFDGYTNINTDELVKRVKDGLSQFSISQRLFGENVLGLSQGSVSDLLARPKPWHMLTQKGREPFIRMQIFLEDAEAIPKLVASQYRIAPEKFLRTEPFEEAPMPIKGCITTVAVGSAENYSSTTGSCTTTISIIPTPPSVSTMYPSLPPPPPSTSSTSTSKSVVSTSGTNTTIVTTTKNRAPSTPSHDAPKVLPPLLPPGPGMPPLGLPPLQNFPHPLLISGASPPNLTPTSMSNPGTPRPMDMPLIPIQPSVFEIAAMSSELDTATITTRVKEVLQYHNLGQKLFGEAVLGLSQGSVSELLSKPKPWHMLSLKGREPFIKMHMWLSDPFNVDRLRIYQNELKAKKRRTSSEDREPLIPSKKARVYFSEEQKETLRLSYSRDPYPNQAKIEQLADMLNVGTKTIVNWFHNHRMRNKSGNSPSMISPPSSTTKSEPEDLSNHSDQSGMAVSMAQWMFPSFEPLPMSNGQFMACSPVAMCSEKAQDLSMTRGDNLLMRNKRIDSSGSLSVKSENSISPGRKSVGGCTPPLVALPPELAIQHKDKPHASVNKRKSSRPKWVYEGTQLDKSLHEADLVGASTFVEQQPQDLSCRSSSEADSTPTSSCQEPLTQCTSPQLGQHEAMEIGASDNNNDKEKSSVNSPLASDSNEVKTVWVDNTKHKGDWNPTELNHDKIVKLQHNLDDKPTTEDWEF